MMLITKVKHLHRRTAGDGKSAVFPTVDDDRCIRRSLPASDFTGHQLFKLFRPGPSQPSNEALPVKSDGSNE